MEILQCSIANHDVPSTSRDIVNTLYGNYLFKVCHLHALKYNTIHLRSALALDKLCSVLNVSNQREFSQGERNNNDSIRCCTTSAHYLHAIQGNGNTRAKSASVQQKSLHKLRTLKALRRQMERLTPVPLILNAFSPLPLRHCLLLLTLILMCSLTLCHNSNNFADVIPSLSSTDSKRITLSSTARQSSSSNIKAKNNDNHNAHQFEKGEQQQPTFEQLLYLERKKNRVGKHLSDAVRATRTTFRLMRQLSMPYHHSQRESMTIIRHHRSLAEDEGGYNIEFAKRSHHENVKDYSTITADATISEVTAAGNARHVRELKNPTFEKDTFLLSSLKEDHKAHDRHHYRNNNDESGVASNYFKEYMTRGLYTCTSKYINTIAKLNALIREAYEEHAACQNMMERTTQSFPQTQLEMLDELLDEWKNGDDLEKEAQYHHDQRSASAVESGDVQKNVVLK